MKAKPMRPLSFIGILSAISFVLAGCAAQVPTVEVQKINIPVPVQVPCPAPSVPARPALPIANLNASSTPADVARAYVATVVVLEGYAAQLEKLLGH